MSLLNSNDVQLAFIGEDKIKEWYLSGSLASYDVVEKIPINCRMVLAGAKTRMRDIPTMLNSGEPLTVASSYPNILKEFANNSGLNLQVSYCPSGSCEAYASTSLGFVDLIFDIKQSGDTLKANDLVVYFEGDGLSLEVIDMAECVDTTDERLEKLLQKVTLTYAERLRQSEEEPYLDSFTIGLFRDSNKCTKKYGEEVAELLQALLRTPQDKFEIINESADLLNIVRIFLTLSGLTLEEVLYEDINRNNKV